MVEQRFHSGAAWLAGAALMLTATAQGAVLDFDVQTEYDDQFTELRSGSQSTWEPASGSTAPKNAAFGAYVFTATSSTTTLTTYNQSNILTDTVEMDLWVETLKDPDSANVGIVTRVQSSSGKGILALATFKGTTSLQLRLFYDGVYTTSSNGPGTAFWDGSFNLSTGVVTNSIGTGGTGSTNALAASTHVYSGGDTRRWSTINPYHLTLEQTSGADPKFTFTVSDAQGLVASTGAVTFTANDDYNAAGKVGLRIGNSGGTIRYGWDNFAVVPEPAFAAMLGLGGLLLARRRQ